MKATPSKDFMPNSSAVVYRSDASGNLANRDTGVPGVLAEDVPDMKTMGCVLVAQTAFTAP
jgi:hypothetical protein